MANFLATDLDHLTAMIKHRFTVIQHRPDVIDGWLTTTGLTLTTTPANTNLPWLSDSYCRAPPAEPG